jgi:hypothetical protein
MLHQKESCPLITASGESDRVWPTAESMYRHYATCFLESRETDESGNLFFPSFYAFRINRANATPSAGTNFPLSSRPSLVTCDFMRPEGLPSPLLLSCEVLEESDIACVSSLVRRVGVLRFPALPRGAISAMVLKTSQGRVLPEILIILIILDHFKRYGSGVDRLFDSSVFGTAPDGRLRR